jgi:hydroxypyruvate isomerase
MSIGLADHFRCSLLHLLAGRIPEAITREKCWETAFENLLWASQQSPAEATLVVEAINPHDMPGFILPKPADALSLVKQINHPSIRLLYDIYHAYRVGEDVMRTLRQERDWIAHIQIADHPGRHQPGTGEIPFEAIFNTLQEIDYPGYIGLEYRPSGSTKASLSWLQNRMAD